MAIKNGFRANAANSVYLCGKTKYGKGSFLFFDAQAGTDLLDDSAVRGLFVDSSNRLSYWNGTSTVRLTGGGSGTTPTWEDIYSVDATFALTTAPWTITQGAAQNLLALNKTNVGAGTVLAITNSGTGNDITGSAWSIATAAAVGVIELTSGGTINATDGALSIGLTGTATTLVGTCTIAEGLTVTAGNTVLTSGNLTLTAGNAVLTLGNFTMTNGLASLTSTSNIAASVAVINNTATTYGAAAASGVFSVESTSLTTGSLVHLELTEATLVGGYYLRAWDITAGAAVFTLGEDGAQVITGADGSNMLTVTAGDVLISEGSITLTDSDNAAAITVTNNTVTTANALVDISSTSISTGAMMRINANAAAHDGEILELINAGDATSTGTGLSITMPSITTGAAKGISVVMAGATTTAVGITVDMAALTTGTGMLLTSAGTMVTTGELLSLVGNAATTCTGLLRVSGTGLTDGFAAELTGGGATATASGGVLNLNAGAATDGAALKITTSGVYAGTVGVVDINAAAATTGTVVSIGVAGLTEGNGLLISAVEATLTTGKYINCYDGAASDFTVGKYGATVIAGNAATNVLTLTAGNAVLTAGNLTLTAGTIIETAQAILNANTAISVTHGVTKIANDGASTHTLADGVEGQKKTIVCTVYVGDAVITPANLANGATITLNGVNDGCDLVFLGTEWFVTNLYGAAAIA